MSRQATVIQTALSEQLRAARNEHVIEPVRLTELVAQSLEIVPDACRQRLTVDTDETLRGLGVVRVARTVLRLILQNLIINAADAVRDAGKDKGGLRLSAQIVSDANGEQLHLHCKDDGVGIAPQNLERVFEKGFSTKSPETNHGIGLHWCANAIGALGGRIWAASEGPGRGASMHLIVPLAADERRQCRSCVRLLMADQDRTPIRVLVVDDEPEVRDAYRQILLENEVSRRSPAFASCASRLFSKSPAGRRPRALRAARRDASSRCSATGAEAAVPPVKEALARSEPFAVVFLDMRMPPGPDGVWAATQIREVDPAIEIVICTAYSDATRARSAAWCRRRTSSPTCRSHFIRTKSAR